MAEGKIKKICISIVCWQDAAFSFDKKLPKILPKPTITSGVIISQTKRFINVGVSVHREGSKFIAVDGIIIPRKSVKKFFTMKF